MSYAFVLTSDSNIRFVLHVFYLGNPSTCWRGCPLPYRLTADVKFSSLPWFTHGHLPLKNTINVKCSVALLKELHSTTRNFVTSAARPCSILTFPTPCWLVFLSFSFFPPRLPLRTPNSSCLVMNNNFGLWPVLIPNITLEALNKYLLRD